MKKEDLDNMENVDPLRQRENEWHQMPLQSGTPWGQNTLALNPSACRDAAYV
jgi:hypothetical protein